jgi:hypothetical protein
MPIDSVWARPRRRPQPAWRPPYKAWGLATAAATAVVGFLVQRHSPTPAVNGEGAHSESGGLGGPSPAAAPVGGRTKLVGRESELRVLAALTDQRRPFIPYRRVAVLRGPAGVGRSRLLQEHSKAAKLEQPERVVVLVDCSISPEGDTVGALSRVITEGGCAATFAELTAQLQSVATAQSVSVPIPLVIIDHLTPPQSAPGVGRLCRCWRSRVCRGLP